MNKTSYQKLSAVITSIAFIALFICFLVLGSQLVLIIKEPIPKLYYGLFGTIGAILSLLIFLKWDGKAFKDIGLVWSKRTPFNLLTGFGLGLGIFTLMILVLITFGGLSIQKAKPIDYSNIAIFLLPFIPLALMEELAFRTYPLLKLNTKIGPWAAQLIIALLFALYHILNGWSIYIAFLGPFIWSFVFGWSALWSRGIAMPFGLHLALNWMQNLTGLKNDSQAIFKLVYSNNPNKELIALNEYLGIGLHLVILGFACLLTHKYMIVNRSSTSLD